jgi:uncharacterized membrane protein YqjE
MTDERRIIAAGLAAALVAFTIPFVSVFVPAGPIVWAGFRLLAIFAAVCATFVLVHGAWQALKNSSPTPKH